MLEDIRTMTELRGNSDAILVVGDVAAKGTQTEYEVAAKFLDRVCELAGVAPDRVACVPGNHDVDRTAQGPLHAAARYQLRGVEAPSISDTLLRLLQDDEGAQTILRPLRAYNDFALRYGCSLSESSLLWKPKVLSLGDRKLRLHGITSAWISDASDSPEKDELKNVVGLFQLAQVADEPNTISVALCHHPLRWIRDAELVKPWLSRAQIVLTGHEHAPGIEVSPDGTSIWIASGAVNPVRTQAGWIPAYNLIELESVGELLDVRVYARSWQRERAEFGPDTSSGRPASHRLRLARLPGEQRDSDMAPSDHRVPPAGMAVVPPEPEPFVSDERQMVYRVMRASPDARRRAARELNLLPPNSEDMDGLEMDRELLRRALEEGTLAALDERIRNA